jgi:hypothetical protein
MSIGDFKSGKAYGRCWKGHSESRKHLWPVKVYGISDLKYKVPRSKLRTC